MKANPSKPATPKEYSEGVPSGPVAFEGEVDLSLLEASLAKTVWERMLANDDALRLADLLQAATLKRRAKS